MSRTWKAWQYRESRDTKVATAGIQVRTGRRWSAEKSLEVAEAQLRHEAYRLGLFLCNESQHLVQEEVQAGMEEVRTSKIEEMGQ